MSSKHTVIKSARELHCGDHVSWPCSYGRGVFRHHAIVIAYKGGNVIKVVHVIPKEDQQPTEYEVRVDTIDLGDNTAEGKLWRYEYEPNECYEPHEVVNRALEKKGKFDYELVSNNCEHFARWCKTGDLKSKQAETAITIALATTTCGTALGAIIALAGIARR